MCACVQYPLSGYESELPEFRFGSDVEVHGNEYTRKNCRWNSQNVWTTLWITLLRSAHTRISIDLRRTAYFPLTPKATRIEYVNGP